VEQPVHRIGQALPLTFEICARGRKGVDLGSGKGRAAEAVIGVEMGDITRTTGAPVTRRASASSARPKPSEGPLSTTIDPASLAMMTLLAIAPPLARPSASSAPRTSQMPSPIASASGA